MNKQLKKAVLEQIGVSKKEFKSNVSDYFNASNGINGFIYHNETHSFALENQSLIVELLEELADSQGIEIVEMVNCFGVFGGEMDKEEKRDLYRFLSNDTNEDNYTTNSVLNVLAWLCVEQLAFEYDR